MTHDREAMPSVVPCLRCGKRGRHKETAYASSRACVEQGRVCDDCYRLMLKDKADERDRKWYSGTWSLTKAQGRIGY